jgi:hypothetical protein
MSNTTNNPLQTSATVERNGITATLKVLTGKRGDWMDRPYQAFQLETDGTEGDVSTDSVLTAGLQFVGKLNVVNALNAIFRRFGQDFVDDATGDKESEAAGGTKDGVLDFDKFVAFWRNLRSSAMRLSELQENYQNQVTEFTAFTTGELMDAFNSSDAGRLALAKQKVESMNKSLVSMKQEFEERKARRSKEKETETVNAQ